MPLTVTLTLVDCEAWAGTPLARVLSPDEAARAARFRHDAERHRFVVRRGLLRRLLSERLGCAPQAVPLRAGPHGKPLLEAAEAAAARTSLAPASWPAFNLSRSGGLVLYALAESAGSAGSVGPGASEGPAMGVDLERVDADRRTLDDLLRIAGHFAPEETRFLRDLPATEATAAFYRLWTCKEACLKSLGTGIGGEGAPTLAEVVLETGSDGQVRRARWPRGGLEWDLVCLEPCADHAAAVALPAGDGRDVDASRRTIELVRLEPASTERRVSPGDAPPPGPGRAAP